MPRGKPLARSASTDSSRGPALLRSPSLPSDLEAGAVQHSLGRFTQAKQEITSIFGSLASCLQDVTAFLGRPRSWVEYRPGHPAVVHEASPDTERELTARALAKTHAIAEAVSRKTMKCVFVGRTSNGKSTTINAMLHAKVLPSGAGHTTNCFIRLRGTNEAAPFACVPGSDERHDVDDLRELAHALYPERHLSVDSVVDLHWPTRRCRMLGEDVVVMDSPGLDIDQDFDSWIDTHCADADVFVLVTNGQGTLNITERRFFQRVSEKISQPNIFVEYNRWDTVVEDEEDTPVDRLRAQHTQNAAALLDGVGSSDPQLLARRVFFVSAREALRRRVDAAEKQAAAAAAAAAAIGGQPAADGPAASTNGMTAREARALERHREFERFEGNFEATISTSAIQTRFGQHTLEGLLMSRQAAAMLSALAQQSRRQRDDMLQHVDVQRRRLAHLTAQRDETRTGCAAHIEAAAVQVRLRVLDALNEHIEQTLPRMVMHYAGARFSPDNTVPFRDALAKHVGEGLHSNLVSSCTDGVRAQLADAVDQMYLAIGGLLPPGVDIRQGRQPTFYFLRSKLDCSAIADGFREDIQFRFSLGWDALGARLLGARGHQVAQLLFPAGLQTRLAQAAVAGAGAGPQAGALSAAVAPAPAVGWFEVVVGVLNSPGGAVALTLGSLALSKPWTLKLLFGGFVAYGALYAYERACFTPGTQERRFKRQFIKHATGQMKLLARQTTLNESQTVEQQLSTTLADLMATVDATEQQLQADIGQQQQQLVELEALAAEAMRLQGLAGNCTLDLERFLSTYLPDATR